MLSLCGGECLFVDLRLCSQILLCVAFDCLCVGVNVGVLVSSCVLL